VSNRTYRLTSQNNLQIESCALDLPVVLTGAVGHTQHKYGRAMRQITYVYCKHANSRPSM